MDHHHHHHPVFFKYHPLLFSSLSPKWAKKGESPVLALSIAYLPESKP